MLPSHGSNKDHLQSTLEIGRYQANIIHLFPLHIFFGDSAGTGTVLVFTKASISKLTSNISHTTKQTFLTQVIFYYH